MRHPYLPNRASNLRSGPSSEVACHAPLYSGAKHFVKPFEDGTHPGVGQLVSDCPPITATRHKALGPHPGQLPRNVGLACPKLFFEFTHRLLSRYKRAQQAKPRRVGQHLENIRCRVGRPVHFGGIHIGHALQSRTFAHRVLRGDIRQRCKNWVCHDGRIVSQCPSDNQATAL